MAGSAPKKDAKALIKAGKLPERSVEVCLHPDLTARMQELERELAEARKARASSGSLASGSTERELAEQIEATRQDMLEHSLAFRLRALPRRQFTALQAEFPPRDQNVYDAAAGVNIEAMAEVLVRRCTVEPVLDDDDWAGLDETLSEGQWQMLTNAAWAINARDTDVPFSQAASRILQSSADE